MNKTLILGLALAVVLVSGSLFSAQAECFNGCLPHISIPNLCTACASRVADRDFDRPDATCQGALQYGPKAPEVMATPSGW